MTVLALEDAKAYLNITEDDKNAELSATINAAVAAIGARVGPLEATAVTEHLFESGRSLVLNTLPVISLTSITPYSSTALSLTSIDVTSAGVIRYLDGNVFTGATSYTVVYQAGWSSTSPVVALPDDLLQAVKELTRHMWTPQRGAGVRPGPNQPETLSNTLPGSATALPFRVEQLLREYKLAGFA